MLAGSTDLLKIGDLLAAPVNFGIFQHDFRIADDGIERRAQLMAHLGKEFGLGAVGGFRFFLGLGQGRHGFPVAGNFLHQAGLGIDDVGIVDGHHEHIGRRKNRRQNADGGKIFERNVDREAAAPVGNVERQHAEADLGEHGKPGERR